MRFTSFFSNVGQFLRQRLVIALLLSALLHVLLLDYPKLEILPLPLAMAPLSAKLVPLPKNNRPHQLEKQATSDATPATFNPNLRAASAIQNSSAPAETSTEMTALAPNETVPNEAASAIMASTVTPIQSAVVQAESAVAALSAPSDKSTEISSVSTTPIEHEPERPTLPKQARLKFDVYQGQGRFKVGEAIHTLQIQNGRYLLKADIHTTGLAGMLKSYRLEQTSSGLASPYQLTPEQLTEQIIDSNGTQKSQILFNWATRFVQFSGGGEAHFPKQAQDILSILYQFPMLKPGDEFVAIFIATTKRAEEYRFEIVFAEKLKTPIGELQTVHFRKRHKANEEGLEIWFAQEYRLLPVKIRHIDSSGKIAGEALITEIRVAD